jgi:hypothetical protein
LAYQNRPLRAPAVSAFATVPMIERNRARRLRWAAHQILAVAMCAPPAQAVYSQSATGASLAQSRDNGSSPANASGAGSQPASSVDLNSLTVDQLQALPLSGRNWQSFLSDAPGSETAMQDDAASNAQSRSKPSTVSVDGTALRLAFGEDATEHNSARSPSPTTFPAGETAIRELQPANSNDSALSANPADGRVNIVTEAGTNHLHGQSFFFDRQSVWGARNPFAKWVKVTSPPTSLTTPTFTPEPYSPSDREWIWGFGLGGVLRRDRLFWFASTDGFHRDNPAVSSVRHPDSFFAQPSNDQMQVLSARLGLSSANPVSAGLGAYSSLLETLSGLLGPAARTSSQWSGFGRIDWSAGERNRLTVEGTAASLDSPGGGLRRVSETYGSHSFGSKDAGTYWLIGRWQHFITSNLLTFTQGSIGRQVQHMRAQTPSPYEQTLDINAWGQLPQIIVDSRYGFTIGNPARFSRGNYPDENLYHAQQQMSWVRGDLLLRAGFAVDHNRDATSRLLNQTGTYHYSTVENFASDALAFAAFGLDGQLDPMHQHNCDQTGKVWRDSTGALHGLGYLPCYSYYSQAIGPSGWWLSTNDWSGYATSQWQARKDLVVSLALRWEREQLPAPLTALANPDLPLTQVTPTLGNQWGPRVGVAFGSGTHYRPVLRFGYGMYFGRASNSLVQNIRTHTGSLNGDLDFFIRPTDNLYGGGAPPFPYVLSGQPASAVKPGAIEFAAGFRNSQIHQAEASTEQALPGHLHLTAIAVASLGRLLPVTLDANIDPAINPKTITYMVVDGVHAGPLKSSQITVPFYASWPVTHSSTGFGGRLNANYQQISEIFSRANSTYEAAMFRLIRNSRTISLRVRYAYSHAMDWNPNETSQVGGSSVLDPANFRDEYGTSNLDVRHMVTAAAIFEPRWNVSRDTGCFINGWKLSGIGQFHSGSPFTMRTAGSLAKEFTVSETPIVALAPGMNGYGGDNRIYGVGRNTYRYPSTWKADVRLGKHFRVGHDRELELLAQSFNLLNHQNVTEIETVGYTIGSGSVNGALPTLNYLSGLKSGQTEFGTPLNINGADFYRERQIQFGARLRF